jgi:hypothetical protein
MCRTVRPYVRKIFNLLSDKLYVHFMVNNLYVLHKFEFYTLDKKYINYRRLKMRVLDPRVFFFREISASQGIVDCMCLCLNSAKTKI